MLHPSERGYTIAELSERTGLAPRTIHFYRAQGLLPRADHRGAGARYPARTLLRLEVIQRLKATTDLSLLEIRTVLASVPEARLERFISGAESFDDLFPRHGSGGDTPSGPASAVASAEPQPAGTRASAPSVPSPLRIAPPGEAPSPSPVTPALAGSPGAGSVVGVEATAQLGALLRALESGARRTVPRAGSRDHWFSVPITADLQLSAHRASGDDVEVLRRIADHIRALLVSGFAERPEGGHGPR